jgi:hypothetical protein
LARTVYIYIYTVYDTYVWWYPCQR